MSTIAKKENMIVKYFKDFSVLRETRREYWSLQIINALDCTAYFAMYNIIVLCLTEDFGLSEVGSGTVFGIFATTVTLSLLVSGMITDWLGIKKAMYVGLVGLLLTRVGVVIAANLPADMAIETSLFSLGPEIQIRHILVTLGLFFMAPFMAMLQTCFQAANKRFTTKRSRGAGFNLWYLYMNIGAAAGGFVVDIFYLTLGLPRYHIFTLGVVLGIICVLVNIFMIKNVEQLYSPGEEPEKEETDAPKEKKTPLQILKDVAGQSVFWRFTLLISLLLGVRSVFLYLGVLHPHFWVRVIGADAQVGTLQAFNPILVIIGLILFIPILKRFNVYNMLVYGALITSISMFIMVIPPFGSIDVAVFTYWTSIGFLFLLTVGELIWSPRLTEYTAAIAPEGQEGTYLGLSMLPYFLAKAIISFGSGFMVAKWVPKDIGVGLRRGTVPFWEGPYTMWFLLGAVALGGTLVAIFMRGYFTKGADFTPPAEKEEEQVAEDAPKKVKWSELTALATSSESKDGETSPIKEAKTAVTWGGVGLFFMGFVCGPVAIIQAMKAKERIVSEKRYGSIGKAKLGMVLGGASLGIWGVGLCIGMTYLALMPLFGGQASAESKILKDCSDRGNCTLACPADKDDDKKTIAVDGELAHSCTNKDGDKDGPYLIWADDETYVAFGYTLENEVCGKWVCWDSEGAKTSCESLGNEALKETCAYTDTGAFCPICLAGSGGGGH